MTIGLSNASKRARYSGSITNISQGGGDKKAGFPYIIGRSYRTSIAFNAVDPVHGKCCTLDFLNKRNLKLVNISRNIGRNNNQSYWHIPGGAAGK